MNLIIPFQKFQFVIEPKERIILPPYKGSTFRGGFGNAFKKVVCICRKTECDTCILKEKCIYSYVFETPPSSDTSVMRKYEKAPHPFIIEPPLEKKQVYGPDDEIIFNLILVGRAAEYLPYFIYSFDELGKKGFGSDRGKYELKKVLAITDSQPAHGNIIYSSETKMLHRFETSNLCLDSKEAAVSHTTSPLFITLDFLTPVRIVYQGQLVLQLEFHILLRNLLRRLALLYYFHCDGDPSVINFKALIEEARKVKVTESNLRWHDWERYSSRQDTKMKLGGSLGTIRFEGELSKFMPYIKAGEVLHVGKGTAFGLGQYRIVL